MSSYRCLLATLLALAQFTDLASRRASADDEVAPLDLVGAQVAVCLEVPRLGSTWSRFQRSQLWTRLKQFPPVERLLTGAGFQKWALVEEHVRSSTGKSLSEQLLGTFSESVVVAVYLADGASPQGVVVAQARDADALKQALQAWSLLEPQHDSRTKEHQGHAYVRRAKSVKSSEVVYYTTFGRTIALSDQERLIHQVIEFHAGARQQPPLATKDPQVLGELALYRTNRSRLPVDDAAAFLFLNTRQWDKVVLDALAQSPDARWIQPAFRQVAAVAASLRLDDEVAVDLVADVTGGPVPPQWRQFVGGTRGGGSWEERVPAGAILAVSSRLELGPLIQAWLATSPHARTEEFARGRNLFKSLLLGRDLFTEILPRAGRDWTIHVAPAGGDAAVESPVNLQGRFSLQGDAVGGDEVPAIDNSIDQTLQFGMTFIAAWLSHQRGAASDGPVIVESERSSAGQIRALKGIRNWSPGYLLSAQQLRVSTSRQELLATDPIPRDPEAGRKSRLADNARRYFGSTTQLAWIDAVRLRSLLAGQSDWIAGQIAPDAPDGRVRLRKHLAKIEEVARIFDAAFLAARFDDDHVRIVFGAALDRSE